MKFSIDIKLGDDAMRSVEDVAEALEKTAAKIRTYADPPSRGEGGRVMDRNGNAVGRWGFR